MSDVRGPIGTRSGGQRNNDTQPRPTNSYQYVVSAKGSSGEVRPEAVGRFVVNKGDASLNVHNIKTEENGGHDVRILLVKKAKIHTPMHHMTSDTPTEERDAALREGYRRGGP